MYSEEVKIRERDETFKMGVDLFEQLLKKKIIRENIELTYKKNNISKSGYIEKIIKIKNNYYFIVYDEIDGSQDQVLFNNIERICGMYPDELAAAYNIDKNGKLLMIEVDEPTNIEKDILGKQYATLNGYEIFNDLKITVYNDKNEKYNNQALVIEGVGDSIKIKRNRGRPRKHRI